MLIISPALAVQCSRSVLTPRAAIRKPPFSAYLGGLDMDGDGTADDLLPGTKVNQFNRGLGKDDLRRLVGEFNRTYAGGNDAHGNFIPAITLPSNFEFNDSFLTQD